MKKFVAIFMSMFLSQIPALAMAEGMISTQSVVADLSRQQAQAEVADFLKQENVRKELQNRGVDAKEIEMRLASLSETELRQLSGQVQEARAGGDILITVLVVVLIIFLIKRI